MSGSEGAHHYIRLLKELFQENTATSVVENAFKFFESNIATQPALISSLIDYYFIYGVTSSSNEYSMNSISNSKSIIDLICLIPNKLCDTFYEKLLEFMNKFPMHQPQPQQVQQNPSDLPGNCTNFFERVTNLLVLLCYQDKKWLDSLPAHSLLNNVIRILKSNTNQTELITVHTCLLFVLLINSNAKQIFNLYAESLFQIFINFFNYQCNLEQKGTSASEVVLSSVKWSVRLYFYVLYGFNASQLCQYLKKKEPQILTKESFTQILFYLRAKPSLLNHVSKESDKQTKQTSEDKSLEWRSYCLDPLCTNYNQVIQNMQNPNALNTNHLSIINNFYFHNNKIDDYKHLMTPTTTNNQASSSAEQFNQSLNVQNNQQEAATQPQNIPNNPNLISPFFLYRPKNISTQFQQSHQTINQTAPNTLGQVTINHPSVSSSVTNTDGLYRANEPQTTAAASSHQGNQIKNSTIKNLTTEFMMNETGSIESYSESQLQTETNSKTLKLPQANRFPFTKSKSDTNLYKDFIYENQASKSIPFHGRKIIPPLSKQQAENYLRLDKPPTYEIGSSEFNNLLNQRRLTSFDIREHHQNTAIKSPTEIDKFVQSISNSLSQSELGQVQTDSLKSSNSTETHDVIKSYFKSISLLRPDNEGANSSVSKLKEEMNHLVIQLIYERHLREKYEKDANRLYFTQIEHDQLLIEKQSSQDKLKQLVEQYKSEVEISLKSQNHLELNAYIEESKEKNSLIENLQNKLDAANFEIQDLSQKLEELKLDHKNIEKLCAESVQSLVKEKNIKTKNEIDYQYMNALRYTTDVLRKKLLLMSKSQYNLKLNQQQQLQIVYNQDLMDIAQLCSSDPQETLPGASIPSGEGLGNTLKNTGTQKIKSSLSLYNNQQNTIDSLKHEVAQLQKAYDSLLITHNSNAVELENCKRNLNLKDAKLEELNHSIQMDSIEMNAEIMKNQYRVYSSLMNVNRRLEEEILKLKANLNEKNLRFSNLEKRHVDQEQEIQHLLDHIKSTNKEDISNNLCMGVS